MIIIIIIVVVVVVIIIIIIIISTVIFFIFFLPSFADKVWKVLARNDFQVWFRHSFSTKDWNLCRLYNSNIHVVEGKLIPIGKKNTIYSFLEISITRLRQVSFLKQTIPSNTRYSSPQFY